MSTWRFRPMVECRAGRASTYQFFAATSDCKLLHFRRCRMAKSRIASPCFWIQVANSVLLQRRGNGIQHSWMCETAMLVGCFGGLLPRVSEGPRRRSPKPKFLPRARRTTLGRDVARVPVLCANAPLRGCSDSTSFSGKSTRRFVEHVLVRLKANASCLLGPGIALLHVNISAISINALKYNKNTGTRV